MNTQGKTCPLRQGQLCTDDCAWCMDGQCAVSVMARQCGRMADEQFTLVEVIGAANGIPLPPAEKRSDGA